MRKTIRVTFSFMLPISLALLITCDSGKSGMELETLDDVLQHISNEHPLIGDIVPFPIPETLEQSQDSRILEVVDKLEESNSFRSYGLGTQLQSAGLSGYEVQSWTEECFDNPPTCVYTEVEGTLTKTVTHIWAYDQWMYRLHYDGYDGEHHYDNFLLQSAVQNHDLRFAKFTVYQNPDHPTLPPGPLFEWIFQVQGQDSYLYTPWDPPQSLATYIHSCSGYFWSMSHQQYRKNYTMISTYEAFTNLKKYELHVWSPFIEDIYLWILILFFSDGHVSWWEYDYHGNIIDSGFW
jgi:hypothetical protein